MKTIDLKMSSKVQYVLYTHSPHAPYRAWLQTPMSRGENELLTLQASVNT